MTKEIKHIFIFLIILTLSVSAIAQDTIQHIEPHRYNSKIQTKQPYVIYISADGFRYDYADKYNAKNLIKLRESGVNALSMKPSYPTVTFSNHYTLATGLYPSHHGLVNNVFYDPNKHQIYSRHLANSLTDSTWYGGVPIWVLAEQQKMLSAVFYWVGSETVISGYKPSYWYSYNTKITLEKRIETVKNWLELPENKRPHLINFYFPEVDLAAHAFGSESKEVEYAVALIDEYVGKMVAMTTQLDLPVNFIFVSDHGMIDVKPKNRIKVPSQIENNDNLIIANNETQIHVYLKDKSTLQSLYNELKKDTTDYNTYLSNETPEHWHYQKKDDKNGRIGDILLTPKGDMIFENKGKKINIGKHGFDNNLKEMQATFYAWGPAFKSGITIPSFENINVYPFIAKILGLKINHPIDGNIKVLEPILKH